MFQNLIESLNKFMTLEYPGREVCGCGKSVGGASYWQLSDGLKHCVVHLLLRTKK